MINLIGNWDKIKQQRSYEGLKLFLPNGFESSPWEWETKAENEMKPISASIFPTLDLDSNLAAKKD